MPETVSRRGFLRKCAAAAVAAPALPAIAGAAALPAIAGTTAGPGRWVNVAHLSSDEIVDFDTLRHFFMRFEYTNESWNRTLAEDRGPDVLPISVGTAAPSW